MKKTQLQFTDKIFDIEYDYQPEEPGNNVHEEITIEKISYNDEEWTDIMEPHVDALETMILKQMRDYKYEI